MTRSLLVISVADQAQKALFLSASVICLRSCCLYGALIFKGCHFSGTTAIQVLEFLDLGSLVVQIVQMLTASVQLQICKLRPSPSGLRTPKGHVQIYVGLDSVI